MQVAPTDISVLVTGESGVGKESFPKIIHSLSHRKHGKYIAVNCGAIPEGTIDSELFGHEKGAFTGATQTREGYFQVADGGTIFLDEVGELPLTTQVRLLRVLENGEFIKVGSSKVQKTNVRIVAATNLDMAEAIKKEKFREDLYYRLSTVEIHLPPLRERKEDIHLLFRKFASDFALKYKMPTIKLNEEATEVLVKYRWMGNIRQLRNVAEQLSVLEKKRLVDAETLKHYLPNISTNLPAIVQDKKSESDFSNEREILYKVLFDMKSDLNDLKKLTLELMKNGNINEVRDEQESLIQKIYGRSDKMRDEDLEEQLEILHLPEKHKSREETYVKRAEPEEEYSYAEEVNEENHTKDSDNENASEEIRTLHDVELELIKKSLERHEGKRKAAAEELGISERTLYRKIKQYNL